MIQQSAEIENNMNSVERIVHYITEIEQEAPHEIPVRKPSVSWLAQGQIVLKDVVSKYPPQYLKVYQCM